MGRLAYIKSDGGRRSAQHVLTPDLSLEGCLLQRLPLQLCVRLSNGLVAPLKKAGCVEDF